MNVWVELKKPRNITLDQLIHITTSHGTKGTAEILYLVHAFAHADTLLAVVLCLLIVCEGAALFLHFHQ